MATKPILFNTEMVRAILDRRKTVTRRVVKPELTTAVLGVEWNEDDLTFDFYCDNGVEKWIEGIKPPYRPGDILYVRETWSTRPSNHCHAQPCHGGQCPYPNCDLADGPCFPDEYIYKASDNLPEYGGKWHPSIHMPKEAARIFLRVTDVRVERLHRIKADECVSEGAVKRPDYTKRHDLVLHGRYRQEFARLWDSTIKPADRDIYGWATNPWVWVIEFERISREEVLTNA